MYEIGTKLFLYDMPVSAAKSQPVAVVEYRGPAASQPGAKVKVLQKMEGFDHVVKPNGCVLVCFDCLSRF